VKLLNISKRMKSHQRGAVALEFILVLPIFIILFFAIVEFGYAWHCQQMLVTASRQGARLGSVFDGNDSITNTSVKAYVNQVLTDYGYPFNYTVHEPVGVDGVSGTNVSVTVTSPYNFPILGGFIGLSDVTLTGKTVMRHE
jgi:Flp pilus assembly protein TadG